MDKKIKRKDNFKAIAIIIFALPFVAIEWIFEPISEWWNEEIEIK
jgi:predicted dinucleotide-binding enzyme